MAGESDVASGGDDLLDKTFKAGFVHIYLLGLAIILAGPTGDWQRGFEIGVWSYFLEFMIISIGYFLLISCLAEMTSIVAFASGAYGYVRCSLGPFYGFMVACCEVMENSFVSITCMYALNYGIKVATGMPSYGEPLVMLLCYLLLFLFQCRGGWYFWTSMCIFAVASAVLIAMYCISILASSEPQHANLGDEPHEKFVRGGAGFMSDLYRPIWLYIGAETVTISGKNIANGPAVIPFALLSVVATIFAFNICVVLLTAVDFDTETHHKWRDLVYDPLPLGYTLSQHLGFSYEAAAALVVAPNFASALGFSYAAMHLTQAMSLSGLASPFFQKSIGDAKVPMRSLIANCAVQYAILVIGWAASDAPPFFALCVIAACVVYVGVFAAYLTFHYKYASMERQFRSPFGVAGAWAGIAIFGVTFWVVVVETADAFVVYVFLAAMVAAGLYYVNVVEARQFFSPEEQRRFMKAYILNANKKKKASSSSSLLRVFERTSSVVASLARLNGAATQHSNSGAQSVGSAAKSRRSVASASTAASSEAKKRSQVAAGDAVAQLPLTLSLARPQPPAALGAAPAATKRTVVHHDDGDVPKLDALRESQPITAEPDAGGDATHPEVQAVWSGKVMDAASSQKFLKFITSGPATSLKAAGSASLKLGGRSSKTHDERAAAAAPIAEDNVLELLREEFPDQVVVLPAVV